VETNCLFCGREAQTSGACCARRRILYGNVNGHATFLRQAGISAHRIPHILVTAAECSTTVSCDRGSLSLRLLVHTNRRGVAADFAQKCVKLRVTSQ
jgi:hypothetical protein